MNPRPVSAKVLADFVVALGYAEGDVHAVRADPHHVEVELVVRDRSGYVVMADPETVATYYVTHPVSA